MSNYIEYLRKYVGHSPILTSGVLLFLFNDKGEVLMQLRSDNNAWGFPGGSMELGESLEEVARRELYEETNLVVDELKFLTILSGKETYNVYPNKDEVYSVTAVYEVTKYHGNIKISDNESKELKWFPLNEIPSNLAFINEKNDLLIKKIKDLLKR